MIKGWDGNTFFAERNRLADIVDQEINPIRKDYLQMVLEMTDFVYLESFTNYQVPGYRVQNAFHNLTASVIAANRYFSVIDDFYCGFGNPLERINAINSMLDKYIVDNIDFRALVDTTTKPTTAVSALLRFYRNFDGELYEIFKEAYENSYLKFFKKHNSILPEGNDGRTYYIDGVRKNFVAIINSRDARLVNNLVHEYGHAIKNLIVPDACYTEEYDYFAEIPSIFPELISLEENVGGYPKLAMDFLKYDNLLEYYNSATVLVSQPDIYLHWKNNDFNNNWLFKRKLLKEEGLGKECIKAALNKDIASDGSYVLSYIVSLELLHIYREDKKEALKLFKKLLQLRPSLTYLGEVKSIIDLNKYANEESERIMDNLTLSLKRRG